MLSVVIVSHVIISIHALHEESDDDIAAGDVIAVFQSTLSMRRATETLHFRQRLQSFQSTLSMRRATDV